MEPTDAKRMAVMWYLVDCLPHLRNKTRHELTAIAAQCDAWSEKEPLHLSNEMFSVPAYRAKPVSAGYVIALFVGCLWVLCGEDEAMAGGLPNAWPIRDALILSPRPTTTTEGTMASE